MSDFETDFQWARLFIPQLGRIIGRHLITEAPAEEDMHRNTDLIVLGMGAIRVACRVRKHHYLAQYGDQFTIRVSRPNGAKTELLKLIEGYGDYLLYAFANAEEQRLCGYFIGRLPVFRNWYWDYTIHHGGTEPGELLTNADNSSKFRAYRISDLPADFIVARYPVREVA